MSLSSSWSGYNRKDIEYRRILVALFAAGFATFAQLYSTQSLLPLITADEGLGPDQAGLSISMATAGLGLSVLVWAALADRYGRVRAMEYSAVLAAAIGLITPFSPTWEILLGVRFVEGVALGALPAVAIAYLGEEIHPKYLAVAAGTFVSGNTVGGLSGRIVAGLVGDGFGWRMGILAVAGMCVVAAAVFLLVVPTARGFVPVKLRRALGEPVLPMKQRFTAGLTNPQLWAVYGIAFMLMGGFVSMYSYIGYHFEQPPFALPMSLTSMIFVVYLVGTVASRFAGTIAFRIGSRRTIAIGVAMMITGALLTLVPSLIVAILGLVLFTYGYFTTSPLSSALTPRLVSAGRAQASAFYQLFYYAGSSLIGWGVGVLLANGPWWHAVVGIVCACAIGGLLALFGLRELPQSEATRQLPVIRARRG